MRVAFLGSPAAAVPTLDALVAGGFDVAHVVTMPDRRRGRGSQLSPTPVKSAAERYEIPVSYAVDDLLDVSTREHIDVGVVVAFGRIIRPHVLQRLPMLNVHFSLLPRWRGAAPVERAILAGDTTTGVCIMAVAEGLDTGGVFASRQVPMSPTITAAELRGDLAEQGAQLLVSVLATDLGSPVPQHGEATYAAKITTDDLRIDWSAPALLADRQIRVGGAWTTFRGKRLKVVAARLVDPDATGATIRNNMVGGVALVTVQPEGKPAMSWPDFANGSRLADGETLV